MRDNLESKVGGVVSKVELPEYVKNTLVNYVYRMGTVQGPIEVTKVKIYNSHYMLNLVLHKFSLGDKKCQDKVCNNVLVRKL
jgi:hypothetical protein